ncbi:MAG: hypothetical protein EZS28_014454 [Streblomastix strix]|uniref:Protein kinase domain-containing protein n=1 Tax=Streblomastix strix TaxID=222440 RepID=A0A5J4W6C9_9EUKA|nr:MAG: hypothetical protein EZS28_014454 [Streblomastix strix]
MEMPVNSTTQDRVSVETYNFDTEEEKNKFQALFELLERLSFPFLALLNVNSEDNKTFCVENENFSRNNVEQFIQKQIVQKEVIDEQKLLDYACQGTLTLAFLHKHKLIHGHISPQNLSIVEDNTLRFGHVDFRVNEQFQGVKEKKDKELKKLQSEDIYNFGKVLYSLSELKEFHDDQNEKQQTDQSTLSDPICFSRLPTGPLKEIIVQLLNKNVDQRPNAIQILAQEEIQERINIWKQLQPNSQSQTEIVRSQFSNYRSYLAQLLVEIIGASIQDRLAIIERGEFVELANILKWARDQNKELSRPIQEWVCEVVQDLINENKQAAIIGLEQTEIVQQLKELLGSDLELEEVKFVHANALKLFTTYCDSKKRKKTMHDIGLEKAVVRNTKSQCRSVSEKSVMTICNILIVQNNQYMKPDQHSYFDQFTQDGIVNALFNEGLINGKSEIAKAVSAYGLGWIYESTPLPEEMKSVIINQLKLGMKNEVSIIQWNTSSALACLAWIEDNHAEILKDDFFDQILKIFLNPEILPGFLFNLLNMIRIFLDVGTEQTYQLIRSRIPIPRIRELTHNQDPYVRNITFLLLSWINNRDQMNKFEKCLKQIDGNSDNKYDNINVNEMMSEINNAIREGNNNVDDNGGLVLVALQIVQHFLLDKKLDFQQELEEGRFIDELFKFYSFIQSDQITDDFTFVLVHFVDDMTRDQKLKMKQEKYITPLIHLIDCKDEDCLAYISMYLADIAIQMDLSDKIQQQNQIRSVFEKNKALPQLLKIMKSENFERDDINSYAAAIIGSIYKASKMPDKFRRIVIQYLKLAAQNEDQEISGYSALVLAGLAECEDNHTEIVAEIIPHTLQKCINEDEYQPADQGMMLAINLLQYGSEETKEKVIEAVPQERVAEYAEQDDDFNGLILAARLLNEWIQFIS